MQINVNLNGRMRAEEVSNWRSSQSRRRLCFRRHISFKSQKLLKLSCNTTTKADKYHHSGNTWGWCYLNV